MKINKVICVALGSIAGVFTGYLLRQPQVNKLKKEIISLQKQLGTLQNKMLDYQKSFDALFIQYKGMKIMQLKKKIECEKKMKDNLIFQYGMKDYLNLILNRANNNKEFSKEETIFYKAFDNIIEGKKVNENTFEKVKEFVFEKHKKEIKELKQCECSEELKEIQEF